MFGQMIITKDYPRFTNHSSEIPSFCCIVIWSQLNFDFVSTLATNYSKLATLTKIHTSLKANGEGGDKRVTRDSLNNMPFAPF